MPPPVELPADVADKDATRLLRGASESIKVALRIAPNWSGSRFTDTDLRQLASMTQALDLMTR